METSGVIIAETGVREGVSKSGRQWKMAGYVLETLEAYPKRVFFEVSDGDAGRIARLAIKQGKRMTIFFDVDAREYEGRWFNTVRVYDAKEI